MVEIKEITKSFGSLQVLKGINLTVFKNEIVAIVGSSGAGKTTLLQIIGSLSTPDSGIITVNGINPFKLKEKELSKFRNKNIGFIFQFHHLLPEFTALENVMMPALIAGADFKKARIEAASLLDYLMLKERLNHKPSELSGGEKQRVAVARALINNPQIILADEPSGSLDTRNKEEIHQLFIDLQRDKSQTFIIVTHDETLAKLANRIIKMKDGLIIQ
jgi:lipoprotein-releasing system ATP-binding protein